MDDNNNSGETKDFQNIDALKEGDIVKPPVAVRDALVKTAVQFLQNPNTRSSPLKLKIAFLKKKGLNDEEVKLAVERSGVDSNPEERDHVTIPMGNFYNQPPLAVMQPPPLPPPSRLLWIRDVANTLMVFGGLGYLIYWFYKKFIRPFLFGKKSPPKKPLEAQIVELDLAVDAVKQNMQTSFERLGADVEKLASQRLDVVCMKSQNDIQELMTQISSLKGLLLNRKQFPAVPATGTVAIPSWQLPSGNMGDEEILKEDDIQSVASDNKSTNGGSDSSLEMIKE